MRTDEINRELFILVVCDKSCDVVVFCADFELIEQQGEDAGVVIGVSSVSTTMNVVSISHRNPRRWSWMGIGVVGSTSCNMCCTILLAVLWGYSCLSHLSERTLKYNVSTPTPYYYVHNPHEHTFVYPNS